MKKQKKLLPKDDVIFQAIFSKAGNEEILRDLINSILGREIKGKLEVQNEVTLQRLRKEEKVRKIRHTGKNRK